jgi:hypothetical protein
MDYVEVIISIPRAGTGTAAATSPRIRLSQLRDPYHSREMLRLAMSRGVTHTSVNWTQPRDRTCHTTAILSMYILRHHRFCGKRLLYGTSALSLLIIDEKWPHPLN